MRLAVSACAWIAALYDGYSIPPYYDSLIGKLIVHGRNRPEALARLKRAWRVDRGRGGYHRAVVRSALRTIPM